MTGPRGRGGAARRRAALLTVLAWVLLVIPALPASAHPMPYTELELSAVPHGLDIVSRVPFGDLDFAVEADLSGDPDAAFAAHRDEIEARVVESLRITSPDGTPWPVTISGLELQSSAQEAAGDFREVTVHASAEAPESGGRQFVVADSTVLGQVVTHVVVVTLAADWARPPLDEPVALGVIRTDTRTGELRGLPVDLNAAPGEVSTVAMLALGRDHILEGTDHLMFLLVLLIPLPLVAAGGRWTGRRRPGASVRSILWITLAFTVGHSASLIAASLLAWAVPARPVEVAIAVSIMVGAVHAARPIFPGREVLVAGLFGLVHGLAFSFVLSDLGMHGWTLVGNLLAFNVGIELTQIAIVAAALPPLIVLSRTRAYTPLRWTAATVCAVAALGWVLDRSGIDTPLAQIADSLGVVGPFVLLALWFATAAVLLRHRGLPTRDEPRAAALEPV